MDNTITKKTVKKKSKRRKVSLPLFLGIWVFPFIFSWFTLRKGHSNLARVISFFWLIFISYDIYKILEK